MWLHRWQVLDGKDYPSPDVEDVNGRRNARSQDPATEDKVKAERFARHIDESSQGPKRAMAKARLLKIQPGIHITVESSSKGQFLG